MKRLLILISVFIILFTFQSCNDNSTNLPEYEINWTATNIIYDNSHSDKHYALLYFYVDDNNPCIRVENNFFSNGDVVDYINRNFNSVKINAYVDTFVTHYDMVMTCIEYANVYNIYAVPTFIILDSNANIIGTQVGYYDREQIMSFFELTITG